MQLAGFKKLGWFIAIWVLSILALGCAAYAIKAVIGT
jgi:hypothetical protein